MTEYQTTLFNIVATMLTLVCTIGALAALLFLYVLVRDFICEELL